MADPTTVVTYLDCKREVAYMLGFNPDSLSAKQTARVDQVIHEAYREYLYPPPLASVSGSHAYDKRAHQWSFLTPMTTFETVSTAVDYTLPDDFGGLLGQLTIDESGLYVPLAQRGEGHIRKLRSEADTDGPPKLAAIRPKAATMTAAQKWEILLWPDPDGAYTIQYRYVAVPDELDSTNLHPMGGATHGQLLLACCRKVAESIENDMRGHHYAQWIERLIAHVMMDRQSMAPETLGYNGDSSDMYGTNVWTRNNYSTVNGVLPT